MTRRPAPRPARAPRHRLAAALLVAAMVSACASSDGVGVVGGDRAPASAAPTTAAGPETVDHLLEVPALHPSVDGYDETVLEIATADGVVHRLAVRVARAREEQLHGLMEVETLPDGTGMWFVFDAERDGGFWMYQTLVPLSIAYIGADGRIVDILDMEPCPTEAGRDCPSYPPDAPYLTTLEVPQGWFGRVGIAEGDVVREAG